MPVPSHELWVLVLVMFQQIPGAEFLLRQDWGESVIRTLCGQPVIQGQSHGVTQAHTTIKGVFKADESHMHL
jgi:hypothetical protein